MAAKIFLDLPGGPKMPALGLGTWQAKDESELITALDLALEIGYRHIDTAFAYENEAIIGKVLKKWFASGKLKREDLFITTKLPTAGVHPDRVELFIKKSLANLQLDYVDLYLIHGPIGLKYVEGQVRPVNEKGELLLEAKTDHAAVWKEMEKQVDAGRAKTIGLSNYNIKQIQTILNSARIKPANLQVELHVYLQQRELVDFCKKNGITVVAYSPLGSPGFNTFISKLFPGNEKELPNILGDSVIARIAKKHGKTPAQVALRFLLQQNVAPIPKSVTPKRLKENIDVFDFKLDDSDLKALLALDQGEKARVCDMRMFKGMVEHPDFPFPKLP